MAGAGATGEKAGETEEAEGEAGRDWRYEAGEKCST